ncbi:MAG: hypothetical protein ACK5AK_05765, partial [Gemmatimonas sp.]
MSAGPLDPTPLVVGVDGGGSRTRVLLSDAAGTVLARVEGSASALRPGEEHAAASASPISALITSAAACSSPGRRALADPSTRASTVPAAS